MKHKLITTMCALATGALFGATNYVVPWEVNPTLMARLAVTDAGGDCVTNITPCAIDVSADGAWLAFSAASATDGARNVRTVRMSDLAAITGGIVVTNANLDAADAMGASDSLGLGSAPLVLATGGSLDATLAIDAANGVAKILPNGGTAYQSWTKRQAPKSVAVSGASLENVAAMALAADGATGVSCAKTGGALTKWTLSATTLTAGATTFATGLDAISSVAVYTIGKPNKAKTTYAVVGEANGSAATAGQVRLVDLATGEATTLLTDAASLGGGIASVRMSRVDTYRPRLYALTTAGNLYCYYLSEDLATVKATYSYTNAELLGFAQAPFAAGAARVTAFDVSADGGTLVAGYAATGDAAPAEAMTLAVLRHTPRKWRHYDANEEGNPATGGVACISDGRWALRWGWATGGIRVGVGKTKTGDVITDYGSAYVNDCTDEFLDLTYGQADQYADGKYKEAHPIVGNTEYGLGTNGVENAGPRVILHSPRCNGSIYHKGWGGVEELVYETTGVANVPAWSGFPSSMKRVVLKMPYCYLINANGLYGSAGSLTETDLSDVYLPHVQNVGSTGFAVMGATGTLDLPAVTNLANYALKEMTGMTELRLSAEAKTLRSVWQGAITCQEKIGYTGVLERVTFGGVDGFKFCVFAFNGAGNNAYQRKIREVAFTGGVPEYVDGSGNASKSDVYVDTAEKTMWFSVPKGHAGWATALEGHVTELTDAERQAVWAANPGRPIPFGVVDKTVFRTKNPQYVCWVGDAAAARLTVEHDDFFGDAVEVTSDLAPAADGSYFPGTTLTLTPKASAAGTFAKWYGDVPGGISTVEKLTLVLTNDVWIYARFTHPWTLSADRKTASNGNFTINCVAVNYDLRQLTLGANAAGGLFADADEGEGTLDLGGKVHDQDGSEWTFAWWYTPNGFFVRTKNGKGNVSTLLTPGTLADGSVWSPNQAFNCGQLKDADKKSIGQASYRLVIADEPKTAGTIGSWHFTGQDNLTKLILRLPRLAGFIGEYAFTCGNGISETDFGWWDISGVTNVHEKAFRADSGTALSACGTMSLPSLCVVPAQTVSGSTTFRALGGFPCVTGLVFGGLTRRATVTEIGAGALGANASLASLRIHNAAEMTVGETPFAGGATPAEITFTGKAIKDDGTAFANLLAGVTAAEAKPVVIYASSKMGWDGTSYIDRNLTEAELAQVPAGEKAIGVYRGGAASPSGKALVLDRSSPYDPRGLLLIVR